MTQARIGFVGLGMMGRGMAKNLVEKGFPLSVVAHRNRAPVDGLVDRGAVEARSLEDLAAASEVVILCVTGSAEVEAVMRRMAPALRPGTFVIDASTSDPTSTLALHEAMKPNGVTFMDAPLGRTPTEAWEGKLDSMVGGSDADFERVRPIIAAYAANIVHAGPIGAGHTLKLVNNFVALGYAAIYAEALALAAKAGIAPKTLDTWLRGTRMSCGFLDTFMRSAVDGDRDAFRFAVRNALKDMRYVENLANGLVVANPLGNAVKNTFALAVAQGRGEEFVPAIAEVVAQANGVGRA
jgi:3-hydroxyisobutyrate dehydrogenase-like beta-hydroxyacid dehydrogenase